MSDAVRGMIVYHRVAHSRGTVTAGNQSNGMIAVQWDDGGRQIIHVSNLMSEKLYNEFKEEERVNQMALKPAEVILDAVVFQVGKTPPLNKGKIVGPLNGSLAIVEWEGGHISKVDIKNLLAEVAGIAENQRLQDEKDRLEREFATVEVAVKDKLADAAKLVNEAAAIANKGNVDIQDMYDATRDLERAMENAGWNTSSWHC